MFKTYLVIPKIQYAIYCKELKLFIPKQGNYSEVKLKNAKIYKSRAWAEKYIKELNNRCNVSFKGYYELAEVSIILGD